MLQFVVVETAHIGDVFIGEVVAVFAVRRSFRFRFGRKRDAPGGFLELIEGAARLCQLVFAPFAVERAGYAWRRWPTSIGVGGVGHVQPECLDEMPELVAIFRSLDDALVFFVVLFAQRHEDGLPFACLGCAGPCVGVCAIPCETVFDIERLFDGRQRVAGILECGHRPQFPDFREQGGEFGGRIGIDVEGAAVIVVVLDEVVSGGADVFGVVRNKDQSAVGAVAGPIFYAVDVMVEGDAVAEIF